MSDQGHSSWADRLVILLAICLSVCGYIYLGYYVPRENTLELLGGYIVLFACYLILYSSLKTHVGKFGIILSIGFRLVLLFSIPALSDDYFRFLWDGRLIAGGISPYAYVPDFIIESGMNIQGIGHQLYASLNFTQHHSMYTPVAQFTGWVAALVASDSIFWSVFILRVFIISAEAGIIFLMIALAKSFGLGQKLVLLYSLNPLVILEFTGNLHHEAFVILFMLASILLIRRGSYARSAVAFGFAVCSKLIPLIFLPFMISQLRLRQVLNYILVVLLVVIILFLPIVHSNIFDAYLTSGQLYFQKFEFNASLYYVFREAGFWVKGYNVIQTAGPRLGLTTLMLILAFTWYAWKRKYPEPLALMWILVIYVAFTTTLHPWYIVPMLAFSIFTNYRFPVVWSFMIFLTYTGYTAEGYSENLWLIGVEYLVVYGVMIYEILTHTPRAFFRFWSFNQDNLQSF